MSDSPSMPQSGAEPKRWKRRARRLMILAASLTLLASPFWYRSALSQLDFFRVRRVEVLGARYVSPDQIVSRLGIDSTASIWDDAGPLELRVGRLTSVREVHIRRRMPGTLVVQVVENLPVALVQSGGGLVAVDASGTTLPIDPTAVDLDVPVLRTRDSLALRLLGEVREEMPEFFARIGDVRRATDGSIAIRLNDPAPRVVLAPGDLSMDRLFDIIPVEADLARRRTAASEIDLRYRGQVIARMP